MRIGGTDGEHPEKACGTAVWFAGAIGLTLVANEPVPASSHAERPVSTNRPPDVCSSHWMPLTSTAHGEPVMASLSMVGILVSKFVNAPGWLMKYVSGLFKVLA